MISTGWKSWLVVVLMAVFTNIKISYVATIETNNLTILVTSCDRYSSLWPGFFKQLFMHIPELRNNDLPIILIGNKKSFPDSRVTTVLTGEDISWSDNMFKALEQVKTDYIFLLLDDYYLTSFNAQRFNEVYHYMINHPEVSYLQLSVPNPSDIQGELISNIPHLYNKGRYAWYRTHLQATLWKTKDFKHLLKPGETAWDFETPGSYRSQGLYGDFLIVGDDFPLNYINVVTNGYVYDRNIELAKIHNIVLENDFPLQKDHRLYLFFKRELAPYVYWEIYLPFKTYLKSFF